MRLFLDCNNDPRRHRRSRGVDLRLFQSEGTPVNSSKGPGLFHLGSSISFVELRFDNPASANKNDLGLATWQPATTPVIQGWSSTAGTVELFITLSARLELEILELTTAVRFSSYPSTGELTSSLGGFVDLFGLINLNAQTTTTTAYTLRHDRCG